jgi:hypothetical protein
MTNLFICKRTVGGNSTSEYGTRYYVYEEVAPVGDLERVREALMDCAGGLSYIRTMHGELYGVGFDRALNAAAEALEILEKMK